MTIGIIGCGNLGESILQGVLKSNKDAKLIVSKRSIVGLKEKYQSYDNVLVTTDNKELINGADVIIIALKPFAVIPFLEENAFLFNKDKHTLVSAVTGVSLAEIGEVVGGDLGLYRVMPNTASAVSESITAISSTQDPLNRKEIVENIFKSIGEVIYINEDLMESATVLGACGIAYVLRFMRAMIQGGIEVGFDAQTAKKIVSQTMKGAAQLIIENGSHPEEEIDKVTTPKGCTIVGLNEMEHSGFSSALIKGIRTSYQKIEK